jgi:hypothetical protein
MAAVLACVWGRLMVSRQRPQPVKLLSHGESVALAAPHRWAHIADPWHGFQDYQKPTAEAGSAENIESGTSMSLARKKHPLRDPAKASGLPPLGPSTPRG